MKYATFRYGGEPGVYLYGDSELPILPDETDVNGYTDISRYVPQFIRNMDEFQAWYESQGHEVGREWELIRLIRRQLFPSTIDTQWGCRLWEQMLGIKPNDNDSIQDRVGAIIAKRGMAQTSTVARIKQVIENITGIECRVTEIPEQYRFVIAYTGQYGVIRNTRTAQRFIEEIKPAHLDYSIDFKYVTWNEVRQFDWSEVKESTWGGLMVLQKIHTDMEDEHADYDELRFKEAGGDRRCGHRRSEL